MKLPEAAAEVIRLADARKVYWNTELPKRHPDYPLVRPEDEVTPPPPEEMQLRKLLSGLPAEVIYKLYLLMQLGRREFGAASLADRYGELKRTIPDPSVAALLLSGMVTLGDYVRDGLAKLNAAGISVDKLPLKGSKVRK